eukprot:TRINITY_DN82991_c0_g1_i1.p1 TRINITY_DN82991_c0_g1~~TRINITY_DN82991_c0_g1_i1.p1  ORF type:complete len:151 (+),score=4.79 TRINITY_DN82991_c0_g1_i1:46-453(+)
MEEAEYALKRLHGIFQKHRIQVNSLVTYTELTKVGAFQPEVESEDSTAIISENIKEIIENHISFWDEDALLVLRETLMYFESLQFQVRKKLKIKGLGLCLTLFFYSQGNCPFILRTFQPHYFSSTFKNFIFYDYA